MMRPGARDRNRTDTTLSSLGILSPVRLPVSPPGRAGKLSKSIYQFDVRGLAAAARSARGVSVGPKTKRPRLVRVMGRSSNKPSPERLFMNSLSLVGGPGNGTNGLFPRVWPIFSNSCAGYVREAPSLHQAPRPGLNCGDCQDRDLFPVRCRGRLVGRRTRRVPGGPPRAGQNRIL